VGAVRVMAIPTKDQKDTIDDDGNGKEFPVGVVPEEEFDPFGSLMLGRRRGVLRWARNGNECLGGHWTIIGRVDLLPLQRTSCVGWEGVVVGFLIEIHEPILGDSVGEINRRRARGISAFVRIGSPGRGKLHLQLLSAVELQLVRHLFQKIYLRYVREVQGNTLRRLCLGSTRCQSGAQRKRVRERTRGRGNLESLECCEYSYIYTPDAVPKHYQTQSPKSGSSLSAVAERGVSGAEAGRKMQNAMRSRRSTNNHSVHARKGRFAA
jgi:hypothetical protein